MELANLMHNLAECGIRDFDRWDEEQFWRYYQTFRSRFGAGGSYDYLAIFNSSLEEEHASRANS